VRIAVIGGGISGLAAAYYLSRKHQVFLFEKDTRLGGHTNTIEVDSSDGKVSVDTGFIVYNERTYPNLVKLFRELGVETQASDMSFSVSDRSTGFEYSSRGLGGFFAQLSNAVRPAHYRLLREILRFNREAPKLLESPAATAMTLGDVMDEGKHTSEFAERYLYPMACAVWSMSSEAIRSFPALTLIRFFDNHGMLGIHTHPKWRVVRGGSNRYLRPLFAPYQTRVYTGVEIESVVRNTSSVSLRFPERPELIFDEVVFACHGDQILPMLESPSNAEREILGSFTTSRNEVCLHTDSSLLPRRPQARASWNYHLDSGTGGATLTYYMNRLQSLDVDASYCVTMNGTGGIDPSKILRRLVYHHPIYNRQAIDAQARWHEISGGNRTHFCGAYWFYGFHEDGLNSALRVARALGVED
jgi:predicted NAD/FAD-binding protein